MKIYSNKCHSFTLRSKFFTPRATAVFYETSIHRSFPYSIGQGLAHSLHQSMASLQPVAKFPLSLKVKKCFPMGYRIIFPCPFSSLYLHLSDNIPTESIVRTYNPDFRHMNQLSARRATKQAAISSTSIHLTTHMTMSNAGMYHVTHVWKQHVTPGWLAFSTTPQRYAEQ